MYHYYSLLKILCVLSLASYVSSTCTPRSCDPLYTPANFNVSTLKSSATNVVRLGFLLHENVADRVSLVYLALNQINNNASILPNTRLEIYTYFAGTPTEVLGSSYATDNVTGVIASLPNEEMQMSQYIASSFGIPQIGIEAASTLFAVKANFPTLARINPPDSFAVKGILAMILQYNFLGCLVITENTGFGLRLFNDFQAAAPLGAEFYPFSLTVNADPSPMDLAILVGTVQYFISYFQLKAIVLLTPSATGWPVAKAFSDAGLYGKHLLYFISSDMTKAKLYGQGLNLPLLDGSFGFLPFDYTPSVARDAAISIWQQANPTIYPGERPLPLSDWYPYDAVFTMAYALDQVQKSGGNVYNSSQVMTQIPKVKFSGASGDIVFDSNNDNSYFVSYYIVNLHNGTIVVSGGYSTAFNNITVFEPFVFYNGSLKPPAVCVCYNGTCDDNGVCHCFEGYTGTMCLNLAVVQTTTTTTTSVENIVPWLVPVVVVLVALLIIGALWLRRRRGQIMKEVALRQRSEIPLSELKFQERIGRGASGEVFKAIFRGTEVAVKVMSAGGASNNALQTFLLETAIMCGLRHPNIILLMGNSYNKEKGEMLLVVELCQRGSLHDVLHGSKISLPLELQLYLAVQAAQGMNFLHESNPPIIHCDLKSHNILLDDKWTAKISDFGITRFKTKDDSSVDGTNMGTVFWSAPEVLAGKSHSEASDCYAFGIVLWELFHRSDPYPGRDLVSVAVDVMEKQLRPHMNEHTPPDIQELIRDCWAQDPAARPTFQVIMTRLRKMATLHPMYNFSSVRDNINAAPSGQVFFVHTVVQSLFALFDVVPRAMKLAMEMYSHIIETNLESYNGFEAWDTDKGMLFAFGDAASAINFCTSVHISLQNVAWPEELIRNSKGETGLTIRTSIHAGHAKSEMDPSRGRMNYTGEVIDEATSILGKCKTGSIVASASVAKDIDSIKKLLIEPITAVDIGDNVHFQLLPSSMGPESDLVSSSTPLFAPPTPSGAFLADGAAFPLSAKRPDWVIDLNELVKKESIGKGAVGDYARAILDGKEVVVKTLVNQKLKKSDVIQLISDASIICKIDHPNLLKYRGLCTEYGNISIIMDYVAKGNLRKILSEELIPMPLSRVTKIALDIATGMNFLTSHPDREIRLFDNFKSNNVMITKDFEVKITDFGQRNVKDLARTMTAISSVAWTAPEILTGEESSEKSSVYAFAIICWELLSRKIPYESEHPIKVVAKILGGYRPSLPADCPAPFRSLIEQCWNGDPVNRPSWNVVVTELSHMQNM